MKKIVVKRMDGGVSIIIPTPEATMEHMIKTAEAVEGMASYRFIDDENIPSDRTFRDAWTDEYNTPDIDLKPSKVKEILLDNLRQERQKEFEEIGVPIKLQDDLEKAILPDDVKAKLQELRDVTEPLKNVVVDDSEPLSEEQKQILIDLSNIRN